MLAEQIRLRHVLLERDRLFAERDRISWFDGDRILNRQQTARR